MIRRSWIVLACLLCLIFSHVANAQDHRAEAIELFRQATAAFEQRDYVAAARAFNASYDHGRRSAAIYNAARAWDAAEQRARAADDYQVALERTDIGGPDAAAASKRLSELRVHLGVLEVVAPPGWRFSVAHVENAPAPLKIHLEPGTQ